MTRTRAILAALIVLLTGSALAGTSLLVDEVLLVRAAVERNTILLLVSNLTAPDPLEGWLASPLVPATLDAGVDRDPDLAVFPGMDDRRLVLAWLKENPATSSLDVALSLFQVPYLPDPEDVLWLSRTAGNESAPKVAADPQGRVHVVWRSPSGTPEYRVLTGRGRVISSQSDLNLPPGAVEGVDVAVDPAGRTWVAVGVSGVQDQVVILSEGDPDEDKPPSGGEIILEPLKLDHSEVQLTMGATFLQPDMQVFEGVPVVLWKTVDQTLGVTMLHFRYRMDGVWRPDPAVQGTARIPLAAGFAESDAVSAVRDLIRSVVTARAGTGDEPPDLDPGLSDGGLSERVLR